MLFLLMLPVVVLVATAHRVLQLHAPSNVLIARARMTPLRWRTALLLAALAMGTLVAMHMLALAVAAGAPGWLNVVVLILAWNSIKFAMVSLQVALRATCCAFQFR